MPYDQHLLERVEKVFKKKKMKPVQKNMIGGLCFMVNNKMVVGVTNDSLMVRIDPELYPMALKKKGCRHMDFNGRTLKGFLLVESIGLRSDKDLLYWIELSLNFNPKAKAAKKKSTPAKNRKL
jgi:TfoX/Sxy family transcriptional regulator of competence genes